MNFVAIPYALAFSPFFLFWAKYIFKVEKSIKTWIVYYIFATISMGLPTFFLPHSNFRVFIIFVLLVIVNITVLRLKLGKSILYVAMTDIVMIVADIMSLLLLTISFEDPKAFIAHLDNDGLLINLFTWLFGVIFTTITLFAKAKIKKEYELLKGKELIFGLELFAFMAAYFFIYNIILDNYMNKISGLPAFLIGILPFLGIAIVLFMFIDKKKTQKHLEEIVELQKSSFALYDNSREFAHDYKNLMLYFQGCVENGDFEKMKSVVDEKLADAQTAYNSSYKIDLNCVEDTGIRWILISKISEAIQNGITFEVSSFENVDWVMKKNEVVDILGILTDNALESAIHSEKRKIVLSLKNEGSGYVLSISNTFGEKPEISKLFDKNYTTKEKHSGIGLSKVKKICDKYENVFLNAVINDDIFSLSIKSTTIGD